MGIASPLAEAVPDRFCFTHPYPALTEPFFCQFGQLANRVTCEIAGRPVEVRTRCRDARRASPR